MASESGIPATPPPRQNPPVGASGSDTPPFNTNPSAGASAGGVSASPASAAGAAGEEQIMDLESYAANYSGHSRIVRLRFIAERCAAIGQTAMELEALRMAADELKRGENNAAYKEVIAKIAGRLGPKYELDQEWVDSVERRAVQKQEKLEMELNGYKTNLIKESIRMGYNDLGDFFYSRGDLQQAFRCYVRTRDYCITSKHTIAMCLNVIVASVELGHFVNVSNYVQKAERGMTDPIVLAKLRSAAGLASLEGRKYKAAARKFVSASFDMGSSYSEVIAPQDVAVYGGLCALASFDRAELKSKLIDSVNFRNFLELVPEVRELIYDFYASRYASCLTYLDKLRPVLELDLHLHDHVAALYQQIRQRALIQYTTPFISVDLRTMASAFNTNVAALEKELAALIMDNQVQARIDSHKGILYARHADQRNATFQRALAAGNDFQRDTRALLIRASLLRAEMGTRPQRLTALLSQFHFNFATTLSSWHLVITFLSLHVARTIGFFEHKAFDPKVVIGFGLLNGASIGLLNLTLGFNSVGFYQMAKLAIIPCTVCLQILFLKMRFSWRNAGGILVALVGMVLYSYVQIQEAKSRDAQISAPPSGGLSFEKANDSDRETDNTRSENDPLLMAEMGRSRG
ncbi:unnamed protein product [Closterium sp. NIES-53]